jgi:galacturan 1,4-alpha-galacturonidase
MQYIDGIMRDIKIAYIGGGSKDWAWKLMADLALEEALSGTLKLYDPDIKAAEDNAIVGNKISNRKDVKGKWNYSVSERLEDALKGSDLVIISILPATFKEMASDVHAPEKYGIYQSVGDTVGPGGLMRGLRTVPIFIDFAENIKRYCPDAWVINFTNPMALCTRALYEAYPGIKAFGCCHEVFSTQALLASMLKDMMGIQDVKRNDIKVNVLGINHFTWMDKASYKNIDLFPVYEKFSKKYKDIGYNIPGEETWEQSVFKGANLVKFDLFSRYNLIAAAGDRHLAEFVPSCWYMKDPETVKSWKFRLTTVEMRIAKDTERLKHRKEVISGVKELELNHSGEDDIKLIKAILGLGDFVANVNFPNRGQMGMVPCGAVVETNALFSKNNVSPVIAGKLPDSVTNLVMRHVLNQETIIKSCLKKDKDLAFTAFINDPLVTLGINDARNLFNEMLSNTKEYLPGWKI